MSYGEVLVDNRDLILRVLDHIVTMSFRYILYCVYCNLYCVYCNLYCDCFKFFCNVLVRVCVGVLVICILVFTVFCMVCTVFFCIVSFMCIYSYLFFLY